MENIYRGKSNEIVTKMFSSMASTGKKGKRDDPLQDGAIARSFARAAKSPKKPSQRRNKSKVKLSSFVIVLFFVVLPLVFN